MGAMQALLTYFVRLTLSEQLLHLGKAPACSRRAERRDDRMNGASKAGADHQQGDPQRRHEMLEIAFSDVVEASATGVEHGIPFRTKMTVR